MVVVEKTINKDIIGVIRERLFVLLRRYRRRVFTDSKKRICREIMRVVFVLLSLLFFIASRRPATALHGDRAGAFIGWHGEITRPTAHSSHLAQPYLNAKGSDHQSTEVKHPSIAFETLVMRDHKPKPSHHASSICEVSSGQFLVAWFAGQFESKPDVGIYTARYQNGKWSNPELIVHPKGVPTWNPVLFKRSNGDLFLFYKHGRTPANWKGYYVKSRDNGNTWSASVALPNGIIGPAKNKPLELDDGTVLLPSSNEFGLRGKDWEIVVEAMTMEDEFKTYSRFAVNEKGGVANVQQRVIQPVFWKQSMSAGGAGSGIRMLARSRSSFAVAAVGDSTGRIWTDAVFSQIPCPNTGFDVVKLRDGRLLIVYNHSFKHAIAGRGVLALAVSYDDGDSWERVMRLEDSGGRLLEFSYPAIIQAGDGMVHVTYTWRRANIKHVIIDPSKISAGESGQSFKSSRMLGGFEKLPKAITRDIV